MSTQGPAIVHYEVYALDGQRWMLHARFRQHEKEAALEEAKMVERSLGCAAKVIRETYYPGNNACDETLVYTSDRSRLPPARPTAKRRPVGDFEPPGFATPDFALPEAAGHSGTSGNTMGVVIKLLLIVAASLVVASGVTAVINTFTTKLPEYGVTVNPQAMSLALFSTFVITFLSSAVPLSISMIERHNNEAARPAPRPKPAPVVKLKPARVASRSAEDDLEDLDDADWDREPEVDWRAAEGNEEAPLESMPPIEPLPPLDCAVPEAAPEKTKDKDKDKEKDAPAGQPDDPLESHRLTMMRFLGGVLSGLKKGRPTLDAYNQFGVDLVLAGAADVLGQQRHLDGKDVRIILKETIEVIGTKADLAQAFADKYETYLVEPRYMAMVQAGRNAMEDLLAGAEAVEERVVPVFEAWNRPQQTTVAPPRIMTILFTDMVGSTDLTQSRGDYAAQDIIRRHNGIVRTALAEYSGKEIKHTGDGIMASFASAANGVEAAIAIQKAVASHNDRQPDSPLHLRIGMNAGEPIAEEDDLFGTTVQLAARVCAAAAADEILCTNVVRELSAGRGLAFVPKGAHALKGFKDPVPLYGVRVQIDEAAPVAALVPPTPAPAAPRPARKPQRLS